MPRMLFDQAEMDQAVAETKVFCTFALTKALTEQSGRPRGQLPEWPNGADCNSAGVSLRWFESITAHDVVTAFGRLIRSVVYMRK